MSIFTLIMLEKFSRYLILNDILYLKSIQNTHIHIYNVYNIICITIINPNEQSE